MPKTMNINLKFDTATSTAAESLKNLRDSVNTYTTTIGDDPNWFNTQTGTGIPKQDNIVYPNEYQNKCPHLLPCGDCAITMRYCHHGGWNWKPEWTCKSED